MPKYLSGRIHYSQYGMFLRCGELFRLVYIEGKRSRPNRFLGIGTSTHKTYAMDLTSKRDKKKLLPLEEIQDTARDEMHKWWDETITMWDSPLLSQADKEIGLKAVFAESVDETVKLSTLAHNAITPLVEPADIESKWVLEVEGFPYGLAGTADVIEVDGTVRDLKTTSRKPSPDRAAKSLQGDMYAMARYSATGRVPDFILDFLVKTKNPYTITQRSSRTVERFQSFLRRFEMFTRAIEAEIFMPCNPEDYLCSPDWCGFYGECEATKGGSR